MLKDVREILAKIEENEAEIERRRRENQKLREKIERVLAEQPSEEELRIATLYMVGKTQAELARQFKRSRHFVQNSINKCAPNLAKMMRDQDRAVKIINYGNFGNFIE